MPRLAFRNLRDRIVVVGETPHGSLRIDWKPEADGQDCRIVTPDGRVVGTARIDLREPAPAPPPTITDADRRLAEARAAVCRDCDRCRGVTITARGREVYRVRCRQCGCGGLSLVRGACPMGKWGDV